MIPAPPADGCGGFTAQEIQFGDFTLDQSRYRLQRGDRSVRLEKLPMELLILLAARGGELVTREEIAERLWGKEVFVDVEHGINTAIRKIRVALGDDPDNPRFVETVVGKGYRFAAPVQLHSEGVGSGNGQASLPPDHPLLSEPLPPQAVAAGSGLLKKKIAIGILLILVCVLASWEMFGGRGSRSSIQPIDSLAVLPFVNAGGGADLQFLSDGLTDSLINAFTQVPNLRVISRTSAFHYKGHEVDPRTVGRELNVHALLVGRMVQNNDDLSVSVELVDTRDDRHLWGMRYDRKLADLIGIQNAIAKDAIDRIRPGVRGADEDRAPTTGTSDPLAYQLFLHGRFYQAEGSGQEWYKSRSYLEQAVARDPGFAAAWSALAYYYWQMAVFGCSFQPAGSPCPEMPREQAWKQSETAALKALQLNESLADAHVALARIYLSRDWDFPAMLRELKRALELNPNSVEGRDLYSTYLTRAGRFDEAIAEAQRAVAIDPFQVKARSFLCSAFSFARRDEEALQCSRKMLEVDPNSAAAFDGIAFAYERKGLYKEAAEFELRSLRLSGSLEEASRFEHIYNTQGYRAATRGLQVQWIKKEIRRPNPSSWDVAYTYARIGKNDEAFRWLERALAERDIGLMQIRIDPDVDGLRSDPRYQALLKRIPFPE